MSFFWLNIPLKRGLILGFLGSKHDPLFFKGRLKEVDLILGIKNKKTAYKAVMKIPSRKLAYILVP